MKIHLILTEEHQQLPIIKNQAVLKRRNVVIGMRRAWLWRMDEKGH